MRARGDLQNLSRSIARTRATLLLVLGVVVWSSRPAHAQSAEAEALFNDGDRLMNEGKLAEACDAFDASNRVEPRAGTLIRLGECREQSHQLASAWSAYKDALTRVKDPRKRELATARVQALEPRLSFLTVVVSDEHRVDGLTVMRNGAPLDPLLWNRELPIDGGEYIIVGRAPGHENAQATARVPIEGGKVRVELPRLADQAAPAAPRPGSLPVIASRPPPHPARWLTPGRKVALALAGAGVASAVTGAVFGKLAQQKQDDAFKLCADPATPCGDADRAERLITAGQRRALAANIAFGVAAAAAVGAGVLWFTGAPETETATRVTVSPGVGTGETYLIVGGSF